MIKNELDLNGEDFNEIKIENVGKVFLSKGNRNSIILEKNSEDRNVDFLIVHGIAFIKTLHSAEENKRDNYNLYITFKSEDISINILNVGSFQTKDKVNFKTIKLKAINCGQINLSVVSQSLFFGLQNVFSLKISGDTDTLTLQKNNVMLSNLRKFIVKNDSGNFY
ncbi:GIN domain-containing protein [Chryseobacterium sp. S-02]|uniref:GIN domain-containing protein n=1 Tax=Chryseobacterium sp. S-02 TaxID=3404064 RepID=UPI003CE825DC